VTHPTDWRCYDSVAETYEQVAVPRFEPMARDLLTALGPPPGARVLDVGTGTGLVAGLAASAVGPNGTVVGVDPSEGMLGIARACRRILAVAGVAPGLPCPDASIDAVAANLVVSHLPDLAGGLADLVRVLRPGGRLGMTAWGPDPTDDDQGAEAYAVVASVREACGLPAEAPLKGAPWEEQLRSRAQLGRSLADAGLHDVKVDLRSYRTTRGIDEYLASWGWGGLGRYLRWEAGERRWHEFTDRAAAALEEQVGDPIESVNQAWVATGTAG
jgi:SAM-dependent methyltransferase